MGPGVDVIKHLTAIINSLKLLASVCVCVCVSILGTSTLD
jgi:hypothetical protein